MKRLVFREGAAERAFLDSRVHGSSLGRKGAGLGERQIYMYVNECGTYERGINYLWVGMLWDMHMTCVARHTCACRVREAD